jgi:hypothetical protein
MLYFTQTSEIENRSSPGMAGVVRPVPCLPKWSNDEQNNIAVPSGAVHPTSGLMNLSRSTSEPPGLAPADNGHVSLRANTVPPALEASATDSRVACDTRTVVGSDTVARRDAFDGSGKHLTRSLVEVSQCNGDVFSDLNSRQTATANQRDSGRGEQIAVGKRLGDDATSWNVAPPVANQSLQQSSAFSMTALDSVALSNHGAGISPSNITIGGGVWRRVQRRDDNVSSVPAVPQVAEKSLPNAAADLFGQQPDATILKPKVTDIKSADALHCSGSFAASPASVNATHYGGDATVRYLSNSTSSLSGRIQVPPAAADVTERKVDVTCNGVDDNNALTSAYNVSSELINNNVVTPHHVREDIPDSELIDYSDDGGESLIDSSVANVADHVRIFVALFDYDPYTMSPNPDAMDVELPFREGQIIQVSQPTTQPQYRGHLFLVWTAV